MSSNALVFLAFFAHAEQSEHGLNASVRAHEPGASAEMSLKEEKSALADLMRREFRTIITDGGDDSGQPCVFPFTYQATEYNSCTLVDTEEVGRSWCATETDAGNYVSGKWGYCPDGASAETSLEEEAKQLTPLQKLLQEQYMSNRTYDITKNRLSREKKGIFAHKHGSALESALTDLRFRKLEEDPISFFLDNCTPNPCKNWGRCTPTSESFTCACMKGYTGRKCQIACESHDECNNWEVCSNSSCRVINNEEADNNGYIIPIFLPQQPAIITDGGAVSGQPCVFPFTFKGTAYNSCTLFWSSVAGRSWCATETDAGNYVSGKWGYCPDGPNPQKNKGGRPTSSPYDPKCADVKEKESVDGATICKDSTDARCTKDEFIARGDSCGITVD